MMAPPLAILPGPPGYVMVSLADLAELLKGSKPRTLPEILHLRHIVRGREIFNQKVQLTRYHTSFVDVYGLGSDACPRLEITLE